MSDGQWRPQHRPDRRAGLTKQYKTYGPSTTCPSRRVRSGDRLPRPERGRQDDHPADAAEPGHPERWHGDHRRPRYADLTDPLRHVGAVLEASSAHKGRTGINHLRVICAAACPAPQPGRRGAALVGLTPAAKRKFKGYSLGMKQRLGIAAAMLGNPEVLILDEPANGLDPEGIRWMRGFLKGWPTRGVPCWSPATCCPRCNSSPTTW
ncbi:hypothetical protein TPA0907_02980 [Micromonospora humidisoli]|nr:hypothetical protein TPA0907_02980 [Micromonospora sp. AKA109]